MKRKNKIFEKKLNEKVSHLTETFEKEGFDKANDEVEKQIAYASKLLDEFHNSPYGKYLDENSKAMDEAKIINKAKKTPFMKELFSLITALFIVSWVMLVFSFILVFTIEKQLHIENVLIFYWFVYAFYFGLGLYFENTRKVKFPKCKRKDKKEGQKILETLSEEISISKGMNNKLKSLIH
jgi:hypothetical protein